MEFGMGSGVTFVKTVAAGLNSRAAIPRDARTFGAGVAVMHNYLRTAILLAGMTALFMGVGYLIGGQTGALIALLIAAATNLFAYWNADRMVLSTYGAQEVDEASAPDLVRLVGELAARAGLPMPRVYIR